jgi:hypothetical protein
MYISKSDPGPLADAAGDEAIQVTLMMLWIASLEIRDIEIRDRPRLFDRNQ